MTQPSSTQFDFDELASRYDRCNHLFSLGMDYRWRRTMVKTANPKIQQRLLDVCCGTGDVVFSFLKHTSAQHVTGLDISEPMLAQARQKQQQLGKKIWMRRKTLVWQAGDAAAIPLADTSIDIVTCAFGIRNMTNRVGFLREAARLLKPRGRVFLLEFSLPVNPILKALYRLYLNGVMPLAGRWVTGSPEPLAYLARSIRHWHTQVHFNAEIADSGLSLVRKVPLTGGVVTLWVIRKV